MFNLAVIYEEQGNRTGAKGMYEEVSKFQIFVTYLTVGFENKPNEL